MSVRARGFQSVHAGAARVLRILIAAVTLCLVIGVVVALAVKLPGLEHDIHALPQKDQIAAQNALLQTMLQFAGGAVVLTGLYFTSRTLYVSQQGQITGRFNDAIEHLGAASMAVRLGGIYALARIAADSARDAATIVEILSAYLRDATAPPPAGPVQGASRLEADVQAVLILLATAEWARSAVIDLRGCRFAGLTTDRMDLRGALLDEAAFYECRMPGSVFDGASLVATDFSEAYLRECSFRGCDAKVAKFTGAHLRHSDFAGANVFGANFDQAYLIGASFDGATDGIRQQFDEAILDETTKLPEFETVG